MAPLAAPTDEDARLVVLARHAPAPDLGDEVLDGLVRLAAELCGTPIALLSLVGEDEQVFAARVGLGVASTPRDVSFCAHAIADPGTTMVVPDAAADRRFADNPLVTGEPYIGFYAGVPLIDEAQPLGTLCVIDRRRRELSPATLAQLEVLARAAEAHLRGRRAERDATQLATILENAPDAFVGMDDDGRVVSWNAAATTLFGWTATEAHGREVVDLVVPPEHWRAHADGVRQLTDPAASHVLGRPLELRARHKDGRDLDIEMTISAVADGDRHLFTAFSRDISARKAVERELGRERRFTEAVLETVGTAIVACDAEGRLTLFNRAARELHGAAAEPVGAEEWSARYDLFEADGRTPLPAGRLPLVRALRGDPVDDVGLVVATPGRAPRAMSASGTAIVDGDGQRLGAVVAMHDVTAREEDRRRTQRHAEDLEALAALTRQLSSSADVGETAQLLVEAARERTGAAAAQLWQPAHDEGLAVTYASGEGEVPVEGALRAWSDGVPVDDGTAWHHPVRDEAVLSVVRPQGDRERLERLMQVLADHAAAALDRAQLLADLGELATTDELTRLPNRRAWQVALGRSSAAARRLGTSSAVAVLDLDRFKAFNDRHGHVAGDELLREAARAWTAELRPSDVLARWGGEEFALLLPHTDVEGAREVVERLRAVVPGGQTCSAGIVVAQPGEDPTRLVARADEALYAAKASGRDRTVLWEEGASVRPPAAPRRRTADVKVQTFERLGDLVLPVEGVVEAARELLGMDVSYVPAAAGDEPVPTGAGARLAAEVRLSDGRLHGMLRCATQASRIDLHEDDVRHLTALARLLAAQVERDEADAASRARAAIGALVSAVEARDAYTAEHSAAVLALVAHVARLMGLDEGERADAEQVALLHDLGKLSIPDAVLHKPGPLDDEEWALMRTHPGEGGRIIGAVPELAHLAPAIRAEHERWDGAGYPDGLAGEAIPLASRIAFVCDAFHAMTSDRPYRTAMSPETALEEIRSGAGTQFCPRAAAALIAAQRAEPASAAAT